MTQPGRMCKKVLQQQQKPTEAVTQKLKSKLQQFATKYQKAVIAKIPLLQYFPLIIAGGAAATDGTNAAVGEMVISHNSQH